MKVNNFLECLPQLGSIFFCLLPLICFSNENKQLDITYKVKYQDVTNVNCISVTANFTPNKKGEIFIRIPPYITEFQSSSSGEIKYQRINESNVYKFSTSSENNVIFSYQVCSENAKRYISHPIVEKELLYLRATDFLILPEAEINRTFKIKFDLSELPAHFKLLTSFNINEKVFEINENIAGLSELVIGTGRVEIKKILIKEQPIYIFLTENLPLNEKIIANTQKIIEEQRSFWKDFKYPHYAVIFIPQVDSEEDRYFKGEHKKNAVIISHPKLEKERLPMFFWVLSHELFHSWLGINLKVPLPQGNLQWFFEGVNDYYGLLFAYKSGAINEKNYINLLNSFIKEYYVSPLNTASNNEIAKYFHFKGFYDKLAQIRGHLSFLNALPVPFEQGKETLISPTPLDKSVKEIYEKYSKDHGGKLTISVMNKTFEKHFGADKWAEIKSHIFDGKILELSPALFAHHAILINKQQEVSNFGFDVSSYVKTHKIGPIATSSNAYKAGLRQGQVVIDDFLSLGQPNALNKMLIQEKNGQRIIEFKPDKMAKFVPQFVFFSPDSQGGREEC